MKPLISVIVLSHNASTTISRALDSILSQSGDFDLEIVVGDDTSTDNTRAIVEDYVQKYPDKVRLLEAAPRMGLVDNYFRCFAACKGEYITDCAADDCFTNPRRLSLQLAALMRNPAAVGVSTDWVEVIDDATEVCHAESRPSLIDILRGGESSVAVMLSTVLFKADVLRKALAENPDLVHNADFGCEDLPVLCALVAAGPIERLAMQTHKYYRGNDTVSNSADLQKRLDFHLATLKCICELADHYDIDLTELSNRIDNKVKYIYSLVFKSGMAENRKRAKQLVEDYKITLPLSARVRDIIMSNPNVWEFVNNLIYKRAK